MFDYFPRASERGIRDWIARILTFLRAISFESSDGTFHSKKMSISLNVMNLWGCGAVVVGFLASLA